MKFNSSEDFENLNDQLYEDSELYDDYYLGLIPLDIDVEDIDDFHNSIGYEEDKIYNGFEDGLDFFSLRRKLNLEDELWIENQTFPYDINEAEIGTSPQIITPNPHGFRIATDADRALCNSGAEIIVVDSLNNPVIYKEFDWGTLRIRNMDTDLLKIINQNKIKDFESISTLIEDNVNADYVIPYPQNCITKAKVERYYYSSVGQLSRARTHAYIPLFSKKNQT